MCSSDLVILLYLIRISLIKVGFPIQWGQLELFDPQKFASSSFNVSLGDFAANSMVVAICCTYLILNYSKFKCIKWIGKSSGAIRFIFGCISLLITFFSFLFPFLFFELVSHNSGISLDITNQVHFDVSRVISFLAVVLGTISSFFFCHVFIRIAISTSNNRRSHFLSMLLVSVLFFILYCLVENHDYTITLVIGVLYILVIYLSGLHHSLYEISFTTYLYLLVTIIAYGSQGALSIRTFNKEARFAAQFRFANSNLISQDNLGEYLLSENIKRIAQDAFIQLRLTNPFLPKEAIRQRINQRYLSSYFDRYESKIYLYNAIGAAVNKIGRAHV